MARALGAGICCSVGCLRSWLALEPSCTPWQKTGSGPSSSKCSDLLSRSSQCTPLFLFSTIGMPGRVAVGSLLPAASSCFRSLSYNRFSCLAVLSLRRDIFGVAGRSGTILRKTPKAAFGT